MKVGITGGIGSGKTTVCKIFEVLGVPVYYADDQAKQLMMTHPELIKKIKSLFGEAAYYTDGSLNRPYIAHLAFNNAHLLAQLNAAVHPIVQEDADQWHQKQQAPYTLKEAALLFESGSFRNLNKIIAVYAPVEVRIQRVMQRDQVSKSQVMSRIEKQLSDADKIQLADFVVTNNGQSPLIPQIQHIHQRLLQSSC
jgi:dephospho-CoA kinase